MGWSKCFCVWHWVGLDCGVVVEEAVRVVRMDTNNNNEHLILVTIVTRCRNEEGIEVTDGGRTGGKTRKRGDGGVVWAKLAFLLGLLQNCLDCCTGTIK
jgi:hypothetical protein